VSRLPRRRVQQEQPIYCPPFFGPQTGKNLWAGPPRLRHGVVVSNVFSWVAVRRLTEAADLERGRATGGRMRFFRGVVETFGTPRSGP